MDVDTEVFERLGQIIAGAHDVADVQSRSNLHIHAGGAIGGCAVKIVRTQAGIADGVIALFVLVALVTGDGGDDVWFFRETCGRYLKVERLIVTVLRGREFFLRRFPPFGQVESYGSPRGALDVAMYRDSYLERLRAEGNDSRLRRDGNGDGRRDDERFDHCSRSCDALYGLNHLRDFKRHRVESKAQFRGKWIGRRRQVKVFGILDIVIRLFDIRASEIGPRERCVRISVNGET